MILVSDVDDTIKRTHVKDPWKFNLVNMGIRSRNPFAGMPELYQAFYLAEVKDEDRRLRALENLGIPEPETYSRAFAYITGAKKKPLHWVSLAFLENSRFPPGDFTGRHFGKTRRFKIEEIRDILHDYPERELILVGDDGEHDPDVFETLVHEFPQKKISVFIHRVYEKLSIPKNQISFYTAADLGIHFLNREWISERDLFKVATIVLMSLKDKKEQFKVFPTWAVARPTEREWPSLSREVSSELARCLEAVKMLSVR